MNKEIFIPVLVILASVALLDPFMVFMPATLVYFLIAALFLITLTYTLIIWREKPLDEREYFIRAYAGRMSFIAGVGVLVLGIIYQVLTAHTVDPVLVFALGIMTIAKYFGYIYAQSRH
jgi:hypothetical protein